MIPKVKLVAHIYNDEVMYEITSKSLAAALQRASLVVEALGTRRCEISHEWFLTKKRNVKHQVIVTVHAA